MIIVYESGKPTAKITATCYSLRSELEKLGSKRVAGHEKSPGFLGFLLLVIEPPIRRPQAPQ
jgi:hypothetical protein